MKRILLILILCFTINNFAQTITEYSSDPNTEFTVVNPATAIDHSPTGMNTTWTFNDLTAIGANIDTYAAPTPTQSSTYSGTTEVVSINDQVTMTVLNELFIKDDAIGSSITGITQGDIIINYNTTNAFIGLFPLNFGDSNTGAVAGVFTFMGASGTFTGTFTTTVDAHGTLNLNSNSTSNTDSYSETVTRLRIDQTLSLNVPPISNIGTLTQTSYYYYENTADNLTFRYNKLQLVSGFLGVNEITEVHERNTALTLSNTENTITDVKLYPNPAEDYLTLTSNSATEIKTISITDITGKMVLNTAYNYAKISIQNLKSGLYFITATTANGNSFLKKFIKK